MNEKITFDRLLNKNYRQVRLTVFIKNAFILLLLVSGFAHSQAAFDKLIANYFYSSLPPYEYVNHDNQAAGIGIEHVKQILTQADYQVAYHYNSIVRGVNFLHLGTYDFASAIAPSAKIRETFLVSQYPIYKVVLGVFRKENTAPLKDINKLKQYEFATLSATAFSFVKEYLGVHGADTYRYDVESFEHGVQLVTTNKLPYFLSYDFSDKRKNLPLLAFDTLITLPVHLIISKQHPKANDYMFHIDNTMRDSVTPSK
jgi:hypothetical protein